jgi:uncharacterized membrane protein
MAVAVAILATIGFIVWLIVKAVKDKGVKAHFISYGIAIIAGVFTFAYFLSLDFPQLIKIVVSIILGIVLIFVAAILQRRYSERSQKAPK